jgi:secreted PhoX family phosphatase
MDRRRFLRTSLAGAAALSLGPTVWDRALGAPARPVAYGPLGPPDANGIRLPAGFTSRVIARSGTPLGNTGYVWHPAPDGGATFPTRDGGWAYVSNSEVPVVGGTSAVVFGPDGSIVGAHRILTGTSMNCAGGPTPWGTWLSGEEHDAGQVWECDPLAPGQGVARPALGTFAHEAAAVDPKRGHVYLTEDKPDGRFYRFTPATKGDLSAGFLEAAKVDARGRVAWLTVPDPNPLPHQTPTRTQLPESTVFNGGEGCWFHADVVYFTTKGDNRVREYRCNSQRLQVIYDANARPEAPLRGVDNVTVARNGDVLVAEDGDDMQICLLRGDTVAPILQVVGSDESEITGPAFDPSGTRLYFSSQRGPAPAGPGITYEVAGPF